MQPLKQFLPGRLGRHEPQRQVGQLVLGIVPGPFRHGGGKEGPEIVDPVSRQRRDHEDAVEQPFGLEFGGQLEQSRALDDVDLVEQQDGAAAEALQAVEDEPAVGIDPLAVRIEDQRDDIRVPRPRPGRRDHSPFETALGREDARGVDEDDLTGAPHGDTAQARPRGLNLARDDGDLGPDQAVQKGRLARVGRSQKGHEAAAQRRAGGVARFGHGPEPPPGAFSNCASRLSAAACSAIRLERPWAVAGC